MKKTVKEQNFLENIPVRREDIKFTSDQNGIVTLEIENKGVFKFLTQKLLKKPRISYIHLDKIGSFIWLQTDGERDIVAIGKAAKEHFGEEIEPLYERLAKYFQILQSYGFVSYK